MEGMKVYCMYNGLNKNAPMGALIKTDDPTAKIDFPSWTVFIKHPEVNILFDAASHKLPERQLPFIMKDLILKKGDTPPERIREIGLEPEDVDILLMSHLHCDHIGYLDAFPNAKIMVHEDEFTYSMRDYGLGTLAAKLDMKHYIDCQLNWELVPNNFQTKELFEGITLYNFGVGHSYGLLGLMLDLPKDGKKFLVGDALYCAEFLENPDLQPGTCYDFENSQKTQEYIKQVVAETGAEIWFGHDLAQVNSLKKSSEGYYE